MGVGYLVAKKINDAKHEIFVEQAKAKAKAIEYEAELVLKDAKNSVLNAELEAKKRYEDKAHKNQKDFNHKLDELHKKEQKLSRYEEQMRLEEEEISKSKRIIQDLHDDGLKLKKLYQDKLDEALRVLEHSAGLTQNEAKNYKRSRRILVLKLPTSCVNMKKKLRVKRKERQIILSHRQLRVLQENLQQRDLLMSSILKMMS